MKPKSDVILYGSYVCVRCPKGLHYRKNILLSQEYFCHFCVFSYSHTALAFGYEVDGDGCLIGRGKSSEKKIN